MELFSEKTLDFIVARTHIHIQFMIKFTRLSG